MNFLAWAFGLFFVYLLLTGNLVPFIQLATQASSDASPNPAASSYLSMFQSMIGLQ